VHFGHRASRWNPKMRPFIYGKRNLIHIIDLRETVRGLLGAIAISPSRESQQPGAVRRHETAGEGIDRARGAAFAACLRQRALARRHPDQLPHIRDRLKRLPGARGNVAAPRRKADRVNLAEHMRNMLNETGKLDSARRPSRHRSAHTARKWSPS